MRIALPPAAHHAAAKKDGVMSRPGARPVHSTDVLVFIVELARLAVLATAGARLGSQATAITLAVILPLVAAIMRGLYLPPRASRRLPYIRDAWSRTWL